jgi:hypothetical protein
MQLITNPAFLVLIGTFISTIGLKIIEHFLNRAKAKDDRSRQLRDELRLEIERRSKDYDAKDQLNRAEIERLHKIIAEAQDEIEKWRAKFYELMEQHIEAKVQLVQALNKIKRGESAE